MTPHWYAPPGEYCKDHTIIEREGVFHLFSISGDSGTSWYYSSSESRLSHSTSTNLRDWSFEGHVLHARGELEYIGADGIKRAWREDKVWAPHCIEAFDRYYMFYTAVEHDHSARDEYDVTSSPDRHVQRICMAVSNDLITWEASPHPAFEEPPGSSARPGRALRDPMVLRDESRGLWIMYVTMMDLQGRNTVGAWTSGDLETWEFSRYVYTEAEASEVITESAFVSKVDGRFYLFMNDGFATADDALGEFGGLQRYSGSAPGWGAGENFEVGGRLWRSLIGGALLIYENGRRIGGEIAVFDLEVTGSRVSVADLKDFS